MPGITDNDDNDDEDANTDDVAALHLISFLIAQVVVVVMSKYMSLPPRHTNAYTARQRKNGRGEKWRKAMCFWGAMFVRGMFVRLCEFCLLGLGLGGCLLVEWWANHHANARSIYSSLKERIINTMKASNAYNTRTQ